MSAQRRAGLLNDYKNALGQHLFFWGRDVVHPRGNLLREFGLERYKRRGVTGSSCYTMSYQGDIIELHSMCVGRYSQDAPSMLYTRQPHECWIYEDDTPPPPGRYDQSLMTRGSLEKIEAASRSFLAWLLEYEAWIAANTHPKYRARCYGAYRRINASKSWLHPRDGSSWLQSYMSAAPHLPRAKNWRRMTETKRAKYLPHVIPHSS